MKSKITLVILLVVMIGFVTLSIFLGFRNIEANKKVDELNLKIEGLTNQIEEEQKLEEKNNKVNEPFIKYDPSKIANNNGEYNSEYMEGTYRGTLSIDGKKVVFNLINFATDYKENKEFNLDENIVSAIKSSLGQGEAELNVFLSETGKVYVNFEAPHMEDKTIELTNLPKIYKIVATSYSTEHVRHSSTVVGIDADGNAYDLNVARKELEQQ